jgi:hypothetical protein
VITEPTVLVLGAGASYPYHFPTAEGLMDEICKTFETPHTEASLLFGIRSEVTSASDFSKFAETLAMSGQASVDAFLEHRTDLIHLGKLAMAYCLKPYENQIRLFSHDTGRGGDWYRYLFGKLNAAFSDFSRNKLSIITFNYDRSLEHYLLTALQNSHRRTFDECAQALEAIPILHVYGQLGEIPYPKSGSQRYDLIGTGSDVYVEAVKASKGIKLLHETKPALEKAYKILFAAKKICFLGFGYHELNIERLAIDTSSAGSKGIFGTCRGLIGGELNAAKTRIRKAIGSSVELGGNDNLETLRHYLILG